MRKIRPYVAAFAPLGIALSSVLAFLTIVVWFMTLHDDARSTNLRLREQTVVLCAAHLKDPNVRAICKVLVKR